MAVCATIFRSAVCSFEAKNEGGMCGINVRYVMSHFFPVLHLAKIATTWLRPGELSFEAKYMSVA